MSNIKNILLILFVGLIGIDRINFIPDGSFVLTPFLLFSLFLIFYLIIFATNDLDISWAYQNRSFIVSLACFLIFIILVFLLQ